MIITIPPITEVIGFMAGIVTIIILAIKKFNEIKVGGSKQTEKDFLQYAIEEKDNALTQRNTAMIAVDNLRETNKHLETEIMKLHHELQLMRNRLSLLTELNNRLATTLDHTQERLAALLDGDICTPLFDREQTSDFELEDSPTLPAPITGFHLKD